MKLVKLKVCVDCESPDIIYKDCVCTYQRNYPIIELEFEQCECCGNVRSQPADTEFNNKQREQYEMGSI